MHKPKQSPPSDTAGGDAFKPLPGTSVKASDPGAAFLKRNQTRRILGIDPGLASTGWGIIDCFQNRYRCVAYGTVETRAGEPHGERLLSIYNKIGAVIREYAPLEAGMESLYFAKNVTSALAVAESRGIIILSLTQNAIPFAEYSPLTIKQSVTGMAKASKLLVQESIKLLLGLSCLPEPDHAADALAAAVTKLHTTSHAEL